MTVNFANKNHGIVHKMYGDITFASNPFRASPNTFRPVGVFETVGVTLGIQQFATTSKNKLKVLTTRP